MRALGLDIGDRRVGIAVSDETGTIARGHGVYIRQGPDADAGHLAKVAHEAHAEVLVVGLPLNMDGSEGEQAAKVRELAAALAATAGLPLHYVDERWTTMEAERALSEMEAPKRKKRALRDELAAVLILQAWLDRKRLDGSTSGPNSNS